MGLVTLAWGEIMVLQLILVKHAKPLINPAVPAAEWGLSSEGRAKCLRLADRLRPYDPSVVISSDEPKARETAEITARRLNLRVQVAPGLHEHDRRGVPFLSDDDFRAAVSKFFSNPSDLVMGRETAHQASERFHLALLASTAKYRSESIVVVTHGTVISLFTAKMTGIEPYPLWERLGLPSFVVLTWPEVALREVVSGFDE